MAESYTLPAVPVKHSNFINHVKSHPQAPIQDLVHPYNQYDAVLRKIYAQQPSHPAVAENLLNNVPLFDRNGEADLQIRARDLTAESEELKAKFMMPLKNEDRRPNGSPAVVSTLKEFQTNFNLFSESSLSDLDWSNVVAAGSAVTTSLVPVPEEYRDSKRGLREFYHEKFAPASDVDLFLYGLTEEQAIEKIKQIETRIKDSILSETSTIRTKNAITIVSQYPTRHVQIVLRIYKSIAEILTGFDVDCSCAAYDGQQVYMAPRAVGAFVTQINQVDLTRRSPSYENRLSKYARRGFEVFWPMLDRSQIDPTIFERSFTRTVGLARLLVLEKLPKPSDRDAYIDKRRRERGRPVPTRNWPARQLRGNIKNDWDDEVPDWDDEQDVSDYHTFTIPYGEKFHARKIERLLYTKDLLLNAEWNKPKDREVNLHRHPAFFGHFDDVVEDCCGFCPVPVTPEEKELAEEESKIYVSGRISFLRDNAGRQEIGSFNPITETDWTEMAYVGNTAGLCQAIVDHDLEGVQEWLAQGHDVNRRDFTGRTALHLAVMTSTPEIVQCLVDQGARLVARLADGRTALHLAAARGSVDMIKTLLTKSEQNEEEEEAKKEKARKEASSNDSKDTSDNKDDGELISHHPESEADDRSFATGSFVKVKSDTKDAASESVPDDTNEQEPDIYDINVIAWDNHASPLHLAIVNGHAAAVEELVSSFGADVLLPIKLLHGYNNTPRAAILTLVLALQLPMEQAKAMTSKLLQLGASPAQADIEKKTSVTYIAGSPKYTELLDLYLEHDHPAVERTINYISTGGWRWNPSAETSLITAIKAGNVIGALKLLEANASPTIDFDEFIKVAQDNLEGIRNNTSDQVKKNFNTHVAQPIIMAVMKDQPSIAQALLARGADPNTMSPDAYRVRDDDYARSNLKGESLLDCVRQKLKDLREYKPETSNLEPPKPLEQDDEHYLSSFEQDTYQMWMARGALDAARERYKADQKAYEERLQKDQAPCGVEEKKIAVKALLEEFEILEAELIAREAKTFGEMYPDIKMNTSDRHRSSSFSIKPPQFKVTVDFKRPDLNEATREGYIQLFEAAWRGDLKTVKTLTMGMWGPENKSPPLEIATKDHRDFCPFHLAIIKGHLDVARAIIAIAEVQYKPEEKEDNVRYRMRTESDEDNDSCCESSDIDEGDREEIGIEKHVLDDRFTIDNIGEVKTQVESKISPLSILQDNCYLSFFLPSPVPEDAKFHTLIQYAIWKDDVELLDFILDLGRELSMKGSNSSDQSIFEAKEWDFTMAMQLGRLRCLKELIKRTGAGLPLDKLAEQSGAEVKEKPKFYQGLSIHGKKRADWAAAGRGITPTQPREVHPPLLVAARQGNVDAVEWFLGTAPGRYYAEFAEAFKHDKRLKRLAMGNKGIERSITSWLECRRDLVLHCAVLSKPTDESEQLVRYLVKTVPHCMEVKSIEGYTPLALAFSLQRYAFAKILIEAGADQTARDKKGNNILHLTLNNATHPSDEKVKALPKILGLIDNSLVPSLLQERSSQDPGALTPLAQWMVQGLTYPTYGAHIVQESGNQMKALKIILDFAQPTGQKHLEVLDGAGNTVIHDAVRCGVPQTLELLVKRRPDLLHRENASGTTPAELAEAAWVAEVTSNPPNHERSNHNLFSSWSRDRYSESLVRRKPDSFVMENDQAPTLKRKIYDFCCKSSEGVSAKRRLVTLFEANEVARRLASKHAEDTGRSRYRSRRRWMDPNEGDFADEVQAWHKSAYQG
ncbi:ankyrin repeat protein [Aspergillus clavatus NRRL 1]|uniref:Ankyrin repeat protein n=1 Tax=Aspergillus clavatus (strain ATCC 1007 / CBS 513.65 / DSM 816 / NCTC 3887 / NRRL 1 / QM 1276 / 107) TaxID=344612 RepID=A1CLM3_ASPCL|nr:ankyrin repeat protein [Aspergillus clavatus NRRL 1]EAW09002.1 ankyrin repeat protein [Aspergillus clavatus NRRL 1]